MTVEVAAGVAAVVVTLDVGCVGIWIRFELRRMDRRMDRLETGWDTRMARQEGRIDKVLALLRGKK